MIEGQIRIVAQIDRVGPSRDNLLGLFVQTLSQQCDLHRRAQPIRQLSRAANELERYCANPSLNLLRDDPHGAVSEFHRFH